MALHAHRCSTALQAFYPIAARSPGWYLSNLTATEWIEPFRLANLQDVPSPNARPKSAAVSDKSGEMTRGQSIFGSALIAGGWTHGFDFRSIEPVMLHISSGARIVWRSGTR
jgi:hypothetical protein